jgi:NitT/TauT family transport system substrate-binding protein
MIRSARWLGGNALLFAALLSACGSGAASPASSTQPPALGAPAPASPSAAASAKPAGSPSAASAKPAVSPSGSTPAKPAASAAGSAALQKVVITYGNISGSVIPLWVANDAGIFQKNGLNVDARLVSEGSTSVAALVSGEAQIAQQGGPEVVNVASTGTDLVVFMDSAPYWPYVMYVPPDIKTPEDLKGKVVDYGNLGGATGTATAVAFNKMGLKQTDVKVAQLGKQTAGTAALLNGEVQARMTNMPDAAVLAAAGFHPLIDLAKDKAPGANSAATTTRAYLNSHKDVIQKVVDSTLEATALAHKDRQMTVNIIKKYFKLDDDAAAQATYDFWVGEALVTVPFPAPEQFKDAVDFSPADNQAAKMLDLNKIIDRSFVQSAADRGLDK